MSYASKFSSSHRGAPNRRQAFHNPHTAMGTAAHYIKEAGILAPFLISEFIEDPAKQWHYIKLASLATAFASQGMWTAKIHAERKAAREHNHPHRAHA